MPISKVAMFRTPVRLCCVHKFISTPKQWWTGTRPSLNLPCSRVVEEELPDLLPALRPPHGQVLDLRRMKVPESVTRTPRSLSDRRNRVEGPRREQVNRLCSGPSRYSTNSRISIPSGSHLVTSSHVNSKEKRCYQHPNLCSFPSDPSCIVHPVSCILLILDPTLPSHAIVDARAKKAEHLLGIYSDDFDSSLGPEEARAPHPNQKSPRTPRPTHSFVALLGA